jgi:hypothetical protein
MKPLALVIVGSAALLFLSRDISSHPEPIRHAIQKSAVPGKLLKKDSSKPMLKSPAVSGKKTAETILLPLLQRVSIF